MLALFLALALKCTRDLTTNEQTESAREARKSFYCDLCQKGYSRVNEFEAHEGSYDHQHKKVSK